MVAGEIEAEEVAAFFERHAEPKPAKKELEAPDSQSESRKQKARLFAPRVLAFEKLNSTLIESEDAWFVAMFGGKQNSILRPAVSAT